MLEIENKDQRYLWTVGISRGYVIPLLRQGIEKLDHLRLKATINDSSQSALLRSSHFISVPLFQLGLILPLLE